MMREARPRAVVFDVGHVLFDWDPRYLYQKLVDDPDRLEWLLANVITKAWHYQHDAGRPFVETCTELCTRYPEQRDLIEVYGPRWLETIPGPVAGSHALVNELDASGVALYAITNFSAEFWEMFRPTAPIFDRFRDVIVSGAEGLVKPDPAIYALARRRFGLGDGEALFIDDNPDNVAAALEAGWAAHRFTDAARARAAIVACGLLPS